MVRSIPAGAGKPAASAAILVRLAFRVYPRECGEAPPPGPESDSTFQVVYPRGCGEARHAFVRDYGIPYLGLSPRVRGSREIATLLSPSASMRSIPAGAGKPAATAPIDIHIAEGLSPRVRGSLA